MEITQGNLEPALVTTIAGSEGNLNDATAWKLVGSRSGTVLFTDTNPGHVVDVQDTAKATVTHTWVAGQTDTLGVGDAQVDVTWPGGRTQTFTAVAAFKVVPNRGD